MTSTIVICSADPAERALARMSCSDPSWYIFECSLDDLASVARSIKIDALVVIGADAVITAARKAMASEARWIGVMLRVRYPAHTRAEVARALGG